MSSSQGDRGAIDGDRHGVVLAAMEMMLWLSLRGGRGRGSWRIHAGGTPRRADDPSPKDGAHPQGPGGTASRGYSQVHVLHGQARRGKQAGGRASLRSGRFGFQPGQEEKVAHGDAQGPILLRCRASLPKGGVRGCQGPGEERVKAADRRESERFKRPAAGRCFPGQAAASRLFYYAGFPSDVPSRLPESWAKPRIPGRQRRSRLLSPLRSPSAKAPPGLPPPLPVPSPTPFLGGGKLPQAPGG